MVADEIVEYSAPFSSISKYHNRPHCCHFIQILSMSHHKDYVRCGRVCPDSTNLLLSASYDHTAALVDIRTGQSGLRVDHGAPIDAIEMLPSGSIFFTAGGNLIKVWDTATGRKLTQLCQHHKAVTCLGKWFLQDIGESIRSVVYTLMKFHCSLYAACSKFLKLRLNWRMAQTQAFRHPATV